MKKFVILFVIITCFYCNKSFSQDTTVQDAVEFIKINLNQGGKSFNKTASTNFDEIFNSDESQGMNYDYDGDFNYSVFSTDYCKITIVERITGKTRISFAPDGENPDEATLYSNFGYLNVDTITIDFSKISRIESDKSSITVVTYNNINSISHNGQTTLTPPKKRTNDLIRDFKENEDVLYQKLKRFMKENNLNYSDYPDKIEKFNYSTNRFIFYNLDKEKNTRLLKAFNFLQKNCGAPGEKF